MDYNDESVSILAESYAYLRDSLNALKEAREGKDGAIIFGEVSDKYQLAKDSIKLLNNLPEAVRERLKIGELEKTLFEFTNLPIGLPFKK